MKPAVIAWIALGLGVVALTLVVVQFVSTGGTAAWGFIPSFRSTEDQRGDCYLENGQSLGRMTLAQCRSNSGYTFYPPGGTQVGPPL